MSQFITKENVHEATDVSRIRNLMANAERLGEAELVLKCEQRISELQIRGKSLSTDNKSSKGLIMRGELRDIDFNYWLNKNSYYGDAPLNKSMRTAQTKMKKDFGITYEFVICNELISEIEASVSGYRKSLDENLAIKAFDLIQLWGGGMGVKGFYYSGTRGDLQCWLPLYLDFINKIDSEENDAVAIRTALDNLLGIKGIGMSFGTKHLKFWAKLPIFDDRISLLLYSKKCKKVDDYLIFLKDMQLLSEVSSLSILEVERSLFAFSQNYFKNDKLVLLREQSVGVDSEIALAIAN